ncbi:hypothetical protein KCP70_25585 [Salmonella enterica subsp. enterica]|nr:hypothetical protein KCP70_25585 [Salmonella enterica subsp. enterica]
MVIMPQVVCRRRSVDSLGQENNPEWKTVAINSNGEMVAKRFNWFPLAKRQMEPLNSATDYRCRN